jgi:Pentapeptide repeats (9 copies)/Pentapeptide repeats (8 copies)
VVTRTGYPQAPSIPDDLPLSGSLDADDPMIVQRTLQGDFSNQCHHGVMVEESHILHASFVGADLSRIRLVDVLVEGADFSGADLEEASLSRVEFVDCRMSGVQMARGTLQDVTFTGCKVDGANFRMSQADRVLLDHVNLRGTEFSAGHLAFARFFDCDLNGVDFSQVVMPGARFHGSSLADIKGGEYVRDIVIDTEQVLPLALRVFTALGIRIEDTRDGGNKTDGTAS